MTFSTVERVVYEEPVAGWTVDGVDGLGLADDGFGLVVVGLAVVCGRTLTGGGDADVTAGVGLYAAAPDGLTTGLAVENAAVTSDPSGRSEVTDVYVLVGVVEPATLNCVVGFGAGLVVFCAVAAVDVAGSLLGGGGLYEPGFTDGLTVE